VLGGGLTGLTTAYYLTKFLPDARVTIYEASNRLGGWVDTEQVAVKTPDGKKGTVRFERGARVVSPLFNSLARWDDLVLYELVSKDPP
jgi:oxygen-dependent protoporphyrinogen oxidase